MTMIKTMKLIMMNMAYQALPAAEYGEDQYGPIIQHGGGDGNGDDCDDNGNLRRQGKW